MQNTALSAQLKPCFCKMHSIKDSLSHTGAWGGTAWSKNLEKLENGNC